jgi:hypothetical protein
VGNKCINFKYDSPTVSDVQWLFFTDKGVVDEYGNWWRYKKQ